MNFWEILLMLTDPVRPNADALLVVASLRSNWNGVGRPGPRELVGVALPQDEELGARGEGLPEADLIRAGAQLARTGPSLLFSARRFWQPWVVCQPVLPSVQISHMHPTQKSPAACLARL
jgi:hypothetical protein